MFTAYPPPKNRTLISNAPILVLLRLKRWSCWLWASLKLLMGGVCPCWTKVGQKVTSFRLNFLHVSMTSQWLDWRGPIASHSFGYYGGLGYRYPTPACSWTVNINIQKGGIAFEGVPSLRTVLTTCWHNCHPWNGQIKTCFESCTYGASFHTGPT